MLQDICVADYHSLKGPLRLNGFPCKRPENVTANDFFSGLLAKPGNTSNAAGSAVTAVNVDNLPGLNTLGVSMARIDFAPWGGVNPPHVHPRATEIIFVLHGSLHVGFVTTANELYARTVRKGEVFVFPRGLVHFQKNNGKTPAAVISAFNSQLPGTQAVAEALFGASPPVPTDVLARAFQIDDGLVKAIESKFQPKTLASYGRSVITRTMAHKLPASILLAACAVLLALTAPLVVAGDPDMLQDICVADYKSLQGPLRVNGFPCKREMNVTADEFFFGGLAKAADVYSGNPMGSATTLADVGKIPGLNTLGVSMARTDYAPWGGVSPPHAHPRATEILFVVEGTLEVGFVTAANRLLSRTVSRGEVFVFPRGLVHFQRSVGPAPAVAVSAFNSQMPGTQTAAAALFGAAPAVPADVLARAFQTDGGVVEKIRSKFPPK
ncbi:Germin-like protein 1-3 [Dichanthelium oligosanthes]|uniref:Germin-like protein 1-3 n=1 Tax=Dichanthelium oligosanthes TaxID=888268 RepID=A0A1E5WK60_9POAL|nr:Germin-like protein 1-3 [Dichanthelium oligosanthes]